MTLLRKLLLYLWLIVAKLLVFNQLAMTGKTSMQREVSG